MSYNGSGTFQINTTGQPVVTGTVISSSAFNALTADLATGLSTAITKDGQTATTVRIPFAQGINSSLTTDTSSGSTGSIYTAGGIGITKGLFVGGTATFSATPVFSALTASSAVATDASKNLVSVTNTGTGNNVLATSPTITTPTISQLTSAAATALTLQSAGTTAVTVDTSQNVGINTTSPNAKLEIKAASASQRQLQLTHFNSTDGWYFTADDTGGVLKTSRAGSSGLNGEAMRIDSSGNVGIGTTTIGQKLVVESNSSQLRLRNTTTRYRSDYNIDSSGNTEINSYDDTGSAYKQIKLNGSPLVFSVGSEAMRIDSSGNVLVNNTSFSSGKFQLYQNAGGTNYAQQIFWEYASGTGYFIEFLRRNSGSNNAVGTIQASTTNVSYNTSSDYRLKENIAPMTGALAKVAALKPVTYKWKIDGSDGEGFLAHELQEICPHAATGEKDGVDENGNPRYQGIDTSFLVATLTAAIQEQQALIASLTDRIAVLEAK